MPKQSSSAKKKTNSTRLSKKMSVKTVKTSAASASVLHKSDKITGTRSKSESLLIFAAILLVAALLYYFRSIFVVATVNGQPVSRIEFNSQIEKYAGKQILNLLITDKLIQQEADKRHIKVSGKEIIYYYKIL